MIGTVGLAAAATCGAMVLATLAGVTGGVASVPPPSTSSPAAQVALTAAMTVLGTPYRWGGDNPSGFDCSGMVQWAYAQAGVALPRTAQQQFDTGPHRAAGTPLQAGDLVFFFGTSPTGIDHVGLYLGAGLMLDAPHTGATVRVDRVAGFTPAFVGATTPTFPPSHR